VGSIEVRKLKSGKPVYRWKARIGGRNGHQVSETFATRKDAQSFDELVAAHGYPPPNWEQGQQRAPKTRTVTESVTKHIDNNVDVQARTRADWLFAKPAEDTAFEPSRFFCRSYVGCGSRLSAA
jgi:hypothetical protein